MKAIKGTRMTWSAGKWTEACLIDPHWNLGIREESVLNSGKETWSNQMQLWKKRKFRKGVSRKKCSEMKYGAVKRNKLANFLVYFNCILVVRSPCQRVCSTFFSDFKISFFLEMEWNHEKWKYFEKILWNGDAIK